MSVGAARKNLLDEAAAAAQGMGSSGGQRMLFAGCSAGARGAMVNMDTIPALLASLNVADNLEARCCHVPVIAVPRISRPSASLRCLLQVMPLLAAAVEACRCYNPVASLAGEPPRSAAWKAPGRHWTGRCVAAGGRRRAQRRPARAGASAAGLAALAGRDALQQRSGVAAR